jgi:hypothetical protein
LVPPFRGPNPSVPEYKEFCYLRIVRENLFLHFGTIVENLNLNLHLILCSFKCSLSFWEFWNY